MSDQFPKTISRPGSGHSVVDWDRALKDYNQMLRQLVSKRLTGRGESAVDDVLQEVAIAAHAAPKGSVAPEKVEAWLKQVAVNKVKDLWRKVERKDRLQADLHQEEITTKQQPDSPFEWVMTVEQTALIHEALDQLSDDERRAMEKKYLGGQSCSQIAREEGLKEKAVEYRLGKARKTMRTILEKIL